MANVALYGVAFILAIFLYVYRKLNFNFNYWKDKGVPQLNPVFLFGDAKSAGGGSYAEKTLHFYKEFKKKGVKHGGIYNTAHKSWIVLDLELIKTILIKDFQYFSAHNPKISSTIFFDNLFHMDGERWRDMRRKLTPTFTSGKMKMMYQIILEKTAGLQRLVDETIEKGEQPEIKALLARFTTDVISTNRSCNQYVIINGRYSGILGSSGFGIECNSLVDTNSDFYRHGQAIFDVINAKPSKVRFFFGLLGLCKTRIFDISKVEDFFSNVVQQTLEYREQNKVVRKDFMHLMIQLKNKGAVTELINENEDVFQKTVKQEAMSLHDIAGQALLFFTAGFETSSTTISFALLELSQNQDVQKKLREHVREVLQKHDGKMTYEALQEMTYVDYVIDETLRKYPPVTLLPRICTKTYTIPNTDIVIEKGTSVGIPVYGLQMDPDYFPEPEKFKPERFSPENKSSIKEMTYMPFGDGPRQCLGMRFGIMQSKAGVAALVSKFNFTLNKKTPYPPKFNSISFITSVDGGIYLNTTRVD